MDNPIIYKKSVDEPIYIPEINKHEREAPFYRKFEGRKSKKKRK